MHIKILKIQRNEELEGKKMEWYFLGYFPFQYYDELRGNIRKGKKKILTNIDKLMDSHRGAFSLDD